MKKFVIGLAVLGGVLAALGRVGPQIGRRAMRSCQVMLDRMPEDFPCKRMLRDIEETRERVARIPLAVEEARGKPAAAHG